MLKNMEVNDPCVLCAVLLYVICHFSCRIASDSGRKDSFRYSLYNGWVSLFQLPLTKTKLWCLCLEPAGDR